MTPPRAVWLALSAVAAVWAMALGVPFWLGATAFGCSILPPLVGMFMRGSTSAAQAVEVEAGLWIALATAGAASMGGATSIIVIFVVAIAVAWMSGRVRLTLEIAGFALGDDKKDVRVSPRWFLLILLLGYCGYTTTVAAEPVAALDKWNWVWKALVFAAFLPLTLRTKLRMEATILTMVLCASDDLCGGALYAQHVEGERPDVTVLPRQHLAHPWTWRRIEARRLGERILCFLTLERALVVRFGGAPAGARRGRHHLAYGRDARHGGEDQPGPAHRGGTEQRADGQRRRLPPRPDAVAGGPGARCRGLAAQRPAGQTRPLLDGARGAGKQPGELRRSQNWIGGARPGRAASGLLGRSLGRLGGRSLVGGRSGSRDGGRAAAPRSRSRLRAACGDRPTGLRGWRRRSTECPAPTVSSTRPCRAWAGA